MPPIWRESQQVSSSLRVNTSRTNRCTECDGGRASDYGGNPGRYANHCTSSAPAELGIREKRASTQELKLDPPAGLAQETRGPTPTPLASKAGKQWTVRAPTQEPNQPSLSVLLAVGPGPRRFPETLNRTSAGRSWALGRIRQVKRLRSGRTGITF